MRLSDKQIADYFHRCFTAVDGLWFMKVEDRLGFEDTLQVDRAVWEILPRIQAREMITMLGLKQDAESLKIAFPMALELKGFTYQVQSQGTGINIVVTRCPWHDVMVKSGRQHLSVKIGQTICPAEYSAWASEFGGVLKFSFKSYERICNGHDTCVLCFNE
jgi:hypothetical protein